MLLSCNDLKIFLELLESYKEQSFKTYTFKLRDKLSTKLQNAIRMAKSITKDDKKRIFNDDFMTPKEYNFIWLLALEKKDRSAIEIVSDYL